MLEERLLPEEARELGAAVEELPFPALMVLLEEEGLHLLTNVTAGDRESVARIVLTVVRWAVEGWQERHGKQGAEQLFAGLVAGVADGMGWRPAAERGRAN